MTPQDFIAKWKPATLSERAACQEHFIDLCNMLGQPTPATADPEGTWFTFERHVQCVDGGKGFADVWKKGHFGWEYKGKHKDLTAAYQQLLRYREDLENPPLLVVCDIDRFEIHTNFTNTAKRKFEFDLDGLSKPANLNTLRHLFTQPDALRPGQSPETVTQQVAEQFGQLADGMRSRGVDPQRAAHFLMKLMFCMFAEDIELLPAKVFHRIVQANIYEPTRLTALLGTLFRAMADGADFGAERILRFNGGLFADADVVPLRADDINALVHVSKFDWGSVEPSIFGTLFERTLDPGKRAQIGAHYTSRDDILVLLEPVVMAPLRREWAEIKAKCDEHWEKLQGTVRRAGAKDSKPRRDHDKLLRDFVERLAHVTILDPACGSGNFLYVAIHLLLELEKEVMAYAARHGMNLLPQVRPTQLAGIEINPYAQQLAQVVIWIGYLQWKYDNGFPAPRDPVLEPIESIRLMDAILDLADPDHRVEPEWPSADFIVGNPPFLGDKKLREALGDAYVGRLFDLYRARIPNQSDLCCYWFEKARREIEAGCAQRAGLLATQGIRGGANRDVLQRINTTGRIFFAESDRPWILDGASVHVSMVGFGPSTVGDSVLDGRRVAHVNANLTSTADVTAARCLADNRDIAFIGVSMHGPFELDDALALEIVATPGNPGSRPNSDVVRPILNALEITRRALPRWVVAFPPETAATDAAMYERPFEFVRATVKPIRDENNRKTYRERWWIHGEARPAMLGAMHDNHRMIATPRVGKHRVFVWVETVILPSDATVAFGRNDDCFFGILQSRLHEVWSLILGTRLETRPRYTPSTCFETFPLPEPTESQTAEISETGKSLYDQRAEWLNPPEWTRQQVLEFPGSVDGPWARYVHNPDSRGIGTVRYPRLVPRDADCAKELAKRTLTNLYNQRPAWLANAHRRLDEEVFAAYGWSPDLSDDEILAKLLELNLQRGKGD